MKPTKSASSLLSSPRPRPTSWFLTTTATILMAGVLSAQDTIVQEDPLTRLFRDAIFEEEANRDLAAAIEGYQALIDQIDQHRRLAANAMFRLSECHRRQGHQEAAAGLLKRIIREFPEEHNLVQLSHQTLKIMGESADPPTATETGPVDAGQPLSLPALIQQRELLREEIQLLETTLTALRNRFEAGVATQEDFVAPQRELLSLKRQLVAIDDQIQTQGLNPEGADAVTMTFQEATELQRIRAMIANSPDLINKPRNGGVLPLHDAVRQGHTSVVALLINQGADPQRLGPSNPGARDNLSPIQVASRFGQLAALRLLLEAGADVNAPGGKGTTALFLACAQGHGEIVQELLNAGANPDIQTGSAIISTSTRIELLIRSPIEMAVYKAHASIVKQLLDAGAKPAGTQPYSLLHLASDRGNPEIATLLLAAGADPNTQDSDGRTPLHIAATNGHTDVMKLLLDHRASATLAANSSYPKGLPNRWVRRGSTSRVEVNGPPLNFAIALNHPDAVELLLRRNKAAQLNPAPPSRSPIMIALETSRRVLLRRLLQETVDLAELPVVETALATMPDQIPSLLAADADPDLYTGETLSSPPLQFSIMKAAGQLPEHPEKSPSGSRTTMEGRTRISISLGRSPVDVDWIEISKTLVQHGADINRTHEGRTVLTQFIHSSAGKDRQEVLAWLLESGADPNADTGNPKSKGQVVTAIGMAIEQDDIEALKLLIQYGAQIDAIDPRFAGPPLQYAAYEGNLAAIQTLLAAGADTESLSDYGHTALQTAVKRYDSLTDTKFNNKEHYDAREERLQIVDALLEGGADADRQSMMHVNLPLIHLAASHRFPELLELLLRHGSNPNRTNEDEQTALHIATAMGHVMNARRLIESGTDVNHQDVNGDTPLHIALTGERSDAKLQVAEILLNAGATPELANALGWKPSRMPNVAKNVPTKPPFLLPDYTALNINNRLTRLLNETEPQP